MKNLTKIEISSTSGSAYLYTRCNTRLNNQDKKIREPNNIKQAFQIINSDLLECCQISRAVSLSVNLYHDDYQFDYIYPCNNNG